MADLEARVRKGGDLTDEHSQKRFRLAQEEIEESKVEGVYDKVFPNDDFEETFKKLEAYIFETEGELKDTTVASGADVEMADESALEADGAAIEEDSIQ